MNDIDVSKAFIIGICSVILLGLPFMFWWHVKQARKQPHLSDDWMIQIMILMAYATAITAEIPAIWSRIIAYYFLKMQIPDGLYKLTAWDRWEHLLFYCFLFLLTYTFTRKAIPKPIRDMLS